MQISREWVPLFLCISVLAQSHTEGNDTFFLLQDDPLSVLSSFVIWDGSSKSLPGFQIQTMEYI